MQAKLHYHTIDFNAHFYKTAAIIVGGAVIWMVMMVVLWRLIQARLAKSQNDNNVENEAVRSRLQIFSIIFVALFLLFLTQHLINALQFFYIPTNSWAQGIFENEPRTFYFGRLLEYSLVYAFSFISLFLFKPQERPEKAFIRLSAAVILIFFTAWGSFQSRYILASIPFLILMAVDFMTFVVQKISSIKLFSPRVLLKAGFILLLVYIAMRTTYLNFVLSYPNDMCYF